MAFCWINGFWFSTTAASSVEGCSKLGFVACTSKRLKLGSRPWHRGMPSAGPYTGMPSCPSGPYTGLKSFGSSPLSICRQPRPSNTLTFMSMARHRGHRGMPTLTSFGSSLYATTASYTFKHFCLPGGQVSLPAQCYTKINAENVHYEDMDTRKFLNHSLQTDLEFAFYFL